MSAQSSNPLSHGIADCSIPVLEAYPKSETAGYGGLWGYLLGQHLGARILSLTAVRLLASRPIRAVVLVVGYAIPVTI